MKKKIIEKVSKSVLTYVYLVVAPQFQVTSSIIANLACAVDAYQNLTSSLGALNEGYAIAVDIKKYQNMHWSYEYVFFSRYRNL